MPIDNYDDLVRVNESFIRDHLGEYVSLKRGVRPERAFIGKVIGLSETKKYIVIRDISDGRIAYYELRSLTLNDPNDTFSLSKMLFLIRSKMQKAKGNTK